jgi:hypothetical protein
LVGVNTRCELDTGDPVGDAEPRTGGTAEVAPKTKRRKATVLQM